MKWYQHSTDSHDDPDISDAMDEFGDAGYSVFFILLELYGREFNSLNSEKWLNLSKRFVARKLRKSWTKVEQILNFYSERQRVFIKIDQKRVSINIPQFVDIASNWTKRKKMLPTEILQSNNVATTAIEKEVEKEVEKKKNVTIFLLDSIEYRLSNYLLKFILKRNPNHKKPNLQAWAIQIDFMLRIDNRTVEDIKKVIQWCQTDSFWQNNILSTKKLREKFDQLFLKIEEFNPKTGSWQTDNNLKAAKAFLEDDTIGN